MLNMGETPPEDRSDETLTPQEAYRLTEENGLMGKTVAKMFDISSARVSQLKKQYQEAKEEGRQEADPSDFEREELEGFLSDETTEDKYGAKCPNCNNLIPKPDSPGEHPCPDCGVKLNWAENEI